MQRWRAPPVDPGVRYTTPCRFGCEKNLTERADIGAMVGFMQNVVCTNGGKKEAKIAREQTSPLDQVQLGAKHLRSQLRSLYTAGGKMFCWRAGEEGSIGNAFDRRYELLERRQMSVNFDRFDIVKRS
jgi:hypothetical protein